MLKTLLRVGVSRGLVGGNRFFTGVAVIAGLFRLVNKLTGNEPKTIFARKLNPGDVVVVTEPKRSK